MNCKITDENSASQDNKFQEILEMVARACINTFHTGHGDEQKKSY